MRRVLIANHGLEQLAGSEIHAMQLAEHFHILGDDVTLAGLVLGEPFLAAANNLGLTVKNLRDPEVRREWDIIWTHQQSCYLLAHAIMSLKARQHIHGCLSYFVRLEASLLGAKDAGVRLLANSDKTSERLDGEFDVFRNITPRPFPANPKISHCPTPRRIVIVSNHPPSELREAATLMRGDGIEVVIYGIEDKYRLIDETVLVEFDVVVTIGKTVQYSLAQAVPVFVYDHFGGPGYLSRDTWKDHEAKNYSGRSSPETKDAHSLSLAILGG